MKKTILIDLDGVLNQYEGNYDKDFIPPIKKGAKQFLENLSMSYDFKIFTSRDKLITKKWMIENNLEKCIVDITKTKDLAWLYIDDRCVRFKGNYQSLQDDIEQFKVWYDDNE